MTTLNKEQAEEYIRQRAEGLIDAFMEGRAFNKLDGTTKIIANLISGTLVDDLSSTFIKSLSKISGNIDKEVLDYVIVNTAADITKDIAKIHEEHKNDEDGFYRAVKKKLGIPQKILNIRTDIPESAKPIVEGIIEEPVKQAKMIACLQQEVERLLEPIHKEAAALLQTATHADGTPITLDFYFEAANFLERGSHFKEEKKQKALEKVHELYKPILIKKEQIEKSIAWLKSDEYLLGNVLDSLDIKKQDFIPTENHKAPHHGLPASCSAIVTAQKTVP